MKVQRVWEVYDDRLQFMPRQDALLLALRVDDASRAPVWSGAAQTALADASQFASWESCQDWGLVLGRGGALFRVVRLGGRKVRKPRSYVADAHA